MTKWPMLFVVGLFQILGCGGGQKQASEQPASQASTGAETDGANLAKHMDANFSLAINTRDAVIGGDLTRAQAKASALSQQDLTGLVPEKWLPGARAMQQSAAKITEAGSLEAAAAAVSQLALTCGQCHESMQGKDEGADAAPTPFPGSSGQTVHDRMLRHRWAADEFWFGITMPSEQAWLGGAQALLEAPLDEGQEEQEGSDAQGEAAAIRAVRDIGRRALDTNTLPERAALYGEFLATCPTCHTER